MPVAKEGEEVTGVPPYLPFARFLQSLDSLAGCMPARIDRTLWSAESAYLATVLVNAYGFLNLVDEHGAPTPVLRRLATDLPSRPAVLREVLQSAYGDVLTEVSRAATAADIERALSRFSVSGATYRKAVSFLLQACRYAAIPISKDVAGKVRLSHARAAASVPVSSIETTTITVALRSGGEITLSGRFNPFALSPEDRRFVFKLADEMTAYGARGQQREDGVVFETEDEVPF